MADVILEKSAPNTMSLSPDEQAMLDEIEIRPPAPRRPKPVRRVQPPPQMSEDIGAFTNPVKQRAAPPPMFRGNYDDDAEEEGEEQAEEAEEQEPQYQGSGGGGVETPSPGYTTIDDEKADLLNKLMRLRKKGLEVNPRLNAYSDISEIRTEYKRLLYGIESEQSIKFSRQLLMACVTGLEMANKRYNPFDLELNGWSEKIMGEIDNYDGVFEELYTKYRTSMHVAPEIKLIMMLGGSGMMFHLTNSMFKAAVPNMNDILKQNPKLVQDMVNAVKTTKAPAQYEEPPVRTTGLGVGGGQSSRRPSTGGRREMQGPGLDISGLLNSGIMMPPMVSTSQREVTIEPVQEVDFDDNMSDIVSVSGGGDDVRDVRVKPARRKKVVL